MTHIKQMRGKLQEVARYYCLWVHHKKGGPLIDNETLIIEGGIMAQPIWWARRMSAGNRSVGGNKKGSFQPIKSRLQLSVSCSGRAMPVE